MVYVKYKKRMSFLTSFFKLMATVLLDHFILIAKHQLIIE